MKRAAALVTGILLLGGASRAQERFRLPGRDGGPVEVQADTLTVARSGEGGRVEGAGHVVLTWHGARLEADRATFDERTNQAEAAGSVSLTDEAGNLLRCRHLTVNVETQEGTVEEGSLTIVKEGYRVWGKRFQKKGPVSYRVEEGGFTACDGTWPSWRVEADTVDVELEGYLKSRGAVFWVEGVPVAYTPWLLFPVKRERQAGFLLPKLGYTTRDGAMFATRYYWPFADNADLTARLEYRSLRGLTEAGELRYVIAEGHSGRVEASHLYDNVDQSHRYTIAADHASRFDDITRARLHVDYLGDTGYLKDFGDTLDQRGTELLESYALVTRDEEPGTYFGFADYVEALNQNQGAVLQTLPSAGLEGRETPLGAGFAFNPSAEVTRFFREQGVDGERAALMPTLAWGGKAAGLGLSARAGYRENLYWLDGQTASRGAARGEVAASLALARPYGGLIHTVEPRLGYVWQEAGRGGVPPSFDPLDEFKALSEVGLALQSRLLKAEDFSPLAALDLDARVDVGRWRRGGWDENAVEPLRGKLSLTPREKLMARAEGEYEVSSANPWLSWSLTAEDGDRRGDRVFAGYHYLKASASYADAGAELALNRALALQYRRRESFRDSRVLEESVGLHLEHPCWEALLTVSRNYREEDGKYEQRYFLAVQLKGLGKLGTLRGVMP